MQIQGEKKHEPHTSKLKQYLNFWKMSTNSSSGGGRALAVSKSSVVTRQWAEIKWILDFAISMKNSPFFTFWTLLFTLLLVFLLPLVQHRRRLCRLLQLGHEVLDVVEAVIEDPLRGGRGAFFRLSACELQPNINQIQDGGITTSLSARRKEISGPPLTVEEERRRFGSFMLAHGSGQH